MPVLVTGSDQEYIRLIGIPFEQTGNQDINTFIQALYRLAIGVAASLAVLKLILAGAQYMFTDVVTSKAEAKKNVRTSLVGLVVVLSAVLVLNTINPELTRLEALNISQVVTVLDTPDRRPPDYNSDNFVAASRECDGEDEDFYFVINETTNVREAVCGTPPDDEADGVSIGTTRFSESLVYSDEERDQIVTQIQNEFDTVITTEIAAVSNDEFKIEEINRNIEQCELNGFTAFQINSRVVDVTNVTVICVLQ